MSTDRQPLTPMAEAMVTLADALGVEIVWPDDRQPTAEELRALPATDRLERELTERQADFQKWAGARSSGLGYDHRKMALKVAERHVRWGWLRDRVVAGWTDYCQCYGDGKVEIAAVVSDGGEIIEPRAWRYCLCRDGDALRVEHGDLRQAEHAARAQALESLIFSYGGDDFAEYATATLDTYRDRLDDYAPAIGRAGRMRVADLIAWSNDRERRWLVLTGETGTGKTGLAVSLLKLMTARGQRGLIVREKSMLDRIRATYDRQRGSDDLTESNVLDELRRVPVLVLDDMGAPGSAVSEWAQGQLFDVLNARYSARRQTIITTNLGMPELETYVGPRIWSRLYERTEGERWALAVNEPDLRKRPEGAR